MSSVCWDILVLSSTSSFEHKLEAVLLVVLFNSPCLDDTVLVATLLLRLTGVVVVVVVVGIHNLRLQLLEGLGESTTGALLGRFGMDGVSSIMIVRGVGGNSNLSVVVLR